MSGLRLEIRGNAGAAARDAARFVAARARRAVEEKGLCTLAFSGGSTPLEMLGALAGEDLPWPSIHVFQVDERVAPRGHAERNLTRLEAALLGPTPLAEDHLHAMPVEDVDLERGADRYAALLSEMAGTPAVLDIVHLGLGDDGHTASLTPGDAALEVNDRDVAVCGAYRDYRRMTLTLPILDRARERLWLVTGAGKVAVLARLVDGDRSIPAGRVRAEDSVVFTDRAAAGEHA